jgi:ABC-type multidrug transport system fused ATPase/permease subunit
MINLINKISILGKQNVNKIKFIVFLNFSTLVIEFLSIGSLPVFVASLINKEETYSKLKNIFGSNLDKFINQQDLPLFLGFFVVLIFIFKNLFFIFLVYLQGNFYKNIKQEFSKKIFNFYSKSNYLILYKKNPSLIVRNITNEIQNLLPYLSHLFNLVKEISAVAVIFLMLIYFEPYSTLVVLFFFFIVSVLYIYFLKPAINKKSNQNQNLRNDFINIVYETFGAGLKDIKLANKEEEINDYFKKKIKIYEENLFIFFFLERLPRLILEVLLIFILFALCIFYLAYSNNNIYNLPSLSLFIIGAIRFLPAFSGITLSRYYLKLFDPSLKGLKNELDIVKNFENSNSYVEDLNPNINFSNTFRIELKNIYFKYPNDKHLLFTNLNLKINYLDKIGISGPSGCGKSTLFDILLGLIKPMRGQVLVNNYEIFKNLKNWRTSIGYVSQNLFILDSTFRENIAFNFGSEKIDNEKVYKAIEISGLTKLINNSENGLETSVGVNGLKLSGGERQRLALARAIYKDPEIFFLDEFTSALDLETEKKIFKKIFKIYNNKTFIIIAHSESVLNHCNKIYFLRDGKLNIKL